MARFKDHQKQDPREYAAALYAYMGRRLADFSDRWIAAVRRDDEVAADRAFKELEAFAARFAKGPGEFTRAEGFADG